MEQFQERRQKCGRKVKKAIIYRENSVEKAKRHQKYEEINWVSEFLQRTLSKEGRTG